MRRASPEWGDAVPPAHPDGPGMDPPDARQPRRPPLGSRAARRAARRLPDGVPGLVPRAPPARTRRGAPRLGAVAAGGVGPAQEGRPSSAGRRHRASPYRTPGDDRVAGSSARRERAGGTAGDPGVERGSAQDSGTGCGGAGQRIGAALDRGGGTDGGPSGVGAGGRAAGHRDAHAPGRDLGAQSGGTGDRGSESRGPHDRRARPAGHVAGGRPHAARAGRSRAGDGDPAADGRREPRDRGGTEAGGGYPGLTRHGGGHRRGPEPLMTNGGGGGGGGAIRIAPSVLSADLSRLAEQVEQVLAGGADWGHVGVVERRFVPNLTFRANKMPRPRGAPHQPS